MDKKTRKRTLFDILDQDKICQIGQAREIFTSPFH